MGGCVALTIRFSEDKTYRGSCWTNTLPEGLWAPAFYIDLDTSRAHAETWLENLLIHRATDPVLEDMWGGHNLCAPLQYGLVLIDYVTSTMISAQGYSSPNWMVRFSYDDKVAKWDALERAGLLRRPGPWPEAPPSAWITMPFTNVECRDVDYIDAALQQRVDTMLGLSDAEKAARAEFIEERSE